MLSRTLLMLVPSERLLQASVMVISLRTSVYDVLTALLLNVVTSVHLLMNDSLVMEWRITLNFLQNKS